MASRDIYASGFDEQTGSTNSADACPECDGHLRTDGGETRCADCGLVVEACRIDRGPEWRSFEDDDRESARTGPTVTPARHDRGISTIIGRGHDANGNALSSETRRRFARLRRQHSRARFDSKADRNLAYACTEIARMTAALGLPHEVREEAAQWYRRAQAANLIRGRSIEALAAGCLYAACRCRGLPRTPSEIATVARVPAAKVRLGYGVVNEHLAVPAQPVGPAERVPKLASAVDAPDVVRRRARALAEQAGEAGLANGRKPSGVAAACLYRASQERVAGLTQAELAESADVAPVTLRARVRELTELVAPAGEA
ncbi:transcription initiation factor IIB [Halobacteriales archaeon Cl-PHB]